MKKKNGILIGRLSGIAAHYVPKYMLENRMPSWNTNCIDDWDVKVNEIIKESHLDPDNIFNGIEKFAKDFDKRHLLLNTNKK